MKNQTSSVIAVIALMGFTLASRGVDLDQLEFPQIIAQPVDQAILLGSNVTFTAQATNGDLSFQWYRNGLVLDGETNNSLSLQSIGIDDAGLYYCGIIKGSEIVPTRAASLNVIALSGSSSIVYGVPVKSSGSQGGCPGSFAGYVTYTKTVSQGWGWAPSTNTTVHTASDGTDRTDTKVEYTGKLGDYGCNQTTVTVPNPATSSKYRFTIYFPSNVPTNSYPMVLSGFDP